MNLGSEMKVVELQGSTRDENETQEGRALISSERKFLSRGNKLTF